MAAKLSGRLLKGAVVQTDYRRGSRNPINEDHLPPHSPEAERGVLGCCLLNTNKTKIALKAGVTTRWFYEHRHIEIFKVLEAMAKNGGGDMVVAVLRLRELGLLDRIGGVPYINQLQDSVPSAENLEYYLPELRAYFQRRMVIDVGTRLRVLAEDTATDPEQLFADAGNVLHQFQTTGDALPEIFQASALLPPRVTRPGSSWTWPPPWRPGLPGSDSPPRPARSSTLISKFRPGSFAPGSVGSCTRKASNSPNSRRFGTCAVARPITAFSCQKLRPASGTKVMP